jgi:hypothetical protein
MSYTAPNAVLVDFVGHAWELLAGNFVSAYLQGSFVIGGFDRYSDVAIIVLDGDVSDEQLPLLQALQENVYALQSRRRHALAVGPFAIRPWLSVCISAVAGLRRGTRWRSWRCLRQVCG